jgi:hypothetical protein
VFEILFYANNEKKHSQEIVNTNSLDYAKEIVRLPDDTWNVSPDSIVFEVVTAPQKSTFPEVEASITATWLIVPQFDVAASNVTVALFEALPLEAAEKAIAFLTYADPEVDISVYNPRYNVEFGLE